MELTQEQLEELDQGKPAPPRAVFYEHAKIDIEKSRVAGQRVYETKLYVRLNQPGVKDNMSYVAQPQDISKYREEYEFFLKNRQGTKVPGIEIIPNLDLAHLQELRDYGLRTIPQLAVAENVPPHLEYARRAAVVFNEALKETSNGYEEENREEVRTREAEDVHAENRQQHRHDVGQPTVPRSDPAGGQPKTSEGNGAGGRPQHRQGVDWGAVRFG